MTWLVDDQTRRPLFPVFEQKYDRVAERWSLDPGEQQCPCNRRLFGRPRGVWGEEEGEAPEPYEREERSAV
jgi:hypothetical protein